MTALLEARGAALEYAGTRALVGCNLVVEAGDRLAVMGASGSGKSSLLHLLAGVLVPSVGSVYLEGVDLGGLSERKRSRLRLERMGVVFQYGDLVPELTLLENVMLPLQLLGRPSREARARALDVMTELGVDALAFRRAGEVSGGEAQRAAVARAVVHYPAVVLADEPTGALDSLTGEFVLDALLTLADRAGTALVVVTHDNQIAAQFDRLVTIRDGRVTAAAGATA